ncbi:hypothetical protein C7H84_35010 [Burkholderia sp. Nafp2/4-1b]|uniref:helix-turn-helix domain-containing protein n=1 Tax=Burkholderia sp. Nafp2/4-1b TaxID=2116686 RepID=UPI000EF8D4EB|nr:helix-turn-helix domain-containing protein [Burkholderia sp. Nafp2/4-1b]RKT98801.1 hypothetical protein C7H84_35010 [Burkholderia sp. Nafp2/4-1b]
MECQTDFPGRTLLEPPVNRRLYMPANVCPVIRQSAASFGAGSLLAIGPGPACEVVCERRSGSPTTLHIDVQSYVLASHERFTVRFEPGRLAWMLNEYTLSSWLAVIDIALGVPPVFRRKTDDVLLEPVTPEWIESSATLSHWLALDVLRGHRNVNLANHLRSLESYRLTRYLISEPVEESQLRELGQRYGVSYSHFRRLCHRAFGCAAKPRLRAWRAARAALQLIEGSDSVLQVAISHGYTSASHITNDIKKLLGVTPSTVRNAHVLLP